MKLFRPLIWLMVLALLGGLAYVVERLIVTDEEAIEALVETAEKAIESGDVDALTATLDPEYQADGRDRGEAVEYVLRLWRQSRPGGLAAELGEIQLEEEMATAPADVTVNLLGRPVRFQVDMAFRKTAEGWRIRAATPRGWLR